MRSGNDPWLSFNNKAQEARENGKEDLEVCILEEAVENNVDTPGTYERLAVIYSKRKEFQKAYEVCEKWFSSIFWKIPNEATTSLKLLDRLEKLEVKIENKGDA
jgi:tetratricopeptide (TPR) repeat protein